MEYNITQATINEVEIVANLFNDYRVWYEQPSDLDGAREFIKSHILNITSTIFIALSDDGQGLGFTQLYPSFTSTGMAQILVLNDLFVAKKARQYGVATALMSTAKQYAKNKGCLRLTLETDHSNNRAQKLYEKLGWVKEQGVYHYTIDL